MKIINVNIKQHGDGKQVYINILTDGGEITIRGDHIAVSMDRQPVEKEQISLSLRD